MEIKDGIFYTNSGHAPMAGFAVAIGAYFADKNKYS